MLTFKPPQEIVSEIKTGNFEVFKAIIEFNNYECVNLFGLKLNDPDLLENFCKALHGTAVHTLILRKNNITDEGAVRLAANLKGMSLRTLNLWDNQIGSRGVIEIINKSKETPLTTLMLGGNDIRADTAGIAKSLKGSKIRDLVLTRNLLGNEGTLTFFKNLTKGPLEVVRIAHNEIDDVAIKGIMVLLPHLGLKALHVELNKIGDDGAIATARCMQKPPFTECFLEYNNLGQVGLTALKKAALSNCFLWGSNLFLIPQVLSLPREIIWEIGSRICTQDQVRAFLKGWDARAKIKLPFLLSFRREDSEAATKNVHQENYGSPPKIL